MPRRSPPAKLLIVTLLMTVAIVVPANVGYAVGLFSDNFESGTLNAWTSTQAFSAQQSIKHAGSWAGRATAASGPTFASKTLASGQSDVYLRSFVRVVSHSGTNQILRMGASTGAGSLVSVLLTSSNQLNVKNNMLAQTRNTGVTIPAGTFVDLQLHLHIGGANGAVELWVNGVPAGGLAGAWDFGTSPIDSVTLGAQAASNPAMDIVYDDVEAATTFIGGGGGTPPPTPTGLSASPFFDHVNLSWNASTGATGYTVYRNGAPLSPTTTVPSFTDSTVQPQTTYQYSVDAFNGSGNSAPTAPITVTTPPAPSGGTVVRAAGDIACDPADSSFNGGNGTSNKCRQRHTAALLPGAAHVLALGDTQYECGGLTAFNQSYNLSWGQQKAITKPILADEDYDTSGTGCGAAGADGYFSYFNAQLVAQPGNTAEDPTKGYYSFDIGSWHVVALNSECIRIPGGCGEGGAQNNWLEADLAASSAQCTVALLHAPLFFSRTSTSQDSSVRPLVEDLYADGVEMVLSGDKHFYERFAPQTPSGTANPNGFVQWIIGVGGKSRPANSLAAPGSRRPHSVTATASTFGVLELTLRSGSYDWDFLVEGSSSYNDSGTASCH